MFLFPEYDTFWLEIFINIQPHFYLFLHPLFPELFQDHYMFVPVLVVPDVETVSLSLWAISSSIQGISTFINASSLLLISIVGSVHTWRKGASKWSSVSEYSARGKGKEVENDIKPIMDPIELPLLDQTIPNPGISTTPNDLSNELGQTLQFSNLLQRYPPKRLDLRQPCNYRSLV